jgi:short-subunit dehydrogenase
MELEGKTILIAGASSGIGLALARLIAREQVRLALLARREDALRGLAEELQDSGSAVLPIKCDVSRPDDVRRSCRKIKARFGPVDVAIFSAGIGHRGARDHRGHFDSRAAREVFEVNLFGLVNFLGELWPDFRRRNSGVVVGISSLADCRGFPWSGFYNSSKAALSSLLESLRVEERRSGLKIITVKPGFVKTPMTAGNRYPMPFLLSAEKAAGIVLRGIKKEKRVIRFPFPTALACRLLEVMPDSLYEAIAHRIKR